jgi:hypothetical protein
MAGTVGEGAAGDKGNVVGGVDAALAAEFAAIHPSPQPPPENEAEYRRRVLARRQSALCLSGGGIRSAAFCLGVVQALSRKQLLTQFDYLSTVSGGGFIGSWLQRLILEHGGPDVVQARLATPAPDELQRLRGFTNYLTPVTGWGSADAWTAIVLYVRNVLLNWMAFLPLFLLAVLAAIFYRTALWEAERFALAPLFLMLAIICLAIGAFRVCKDLPSHRQRRAGAVPAYAPVEKVQHWIVYPSLAWAFLAPASLPQWLNATAQKLDLSGATPVLTQMMQGDACFITLPTHCVGTLPRWYFTVTSLPFVYLLTMLVVYAAAALWRRRSDQNVRLYSENLPAWLWSSVVATAAICVGLALLRWLASSDIAATLAVMGPVWLVLCSMLQAMVFVGLRRDAAFGDLDREWLARLSALKFRAAMGWMLFGICCLWVPGAAFHKPGDHTPFYVAGVVTLLSGPGAAWLGKQVMARLSQFISDPTKAGISQAWLLNGLSAVFAVGLLALLGFAMGEALGQVQLGLTGLIGLPWIEPHISNWSEVRRWLAWYLTDPLPIQAVTCAALCYLIVRQSRRINVNRYSMHGVYRNRLIRAFLGTARAARRHAEPFTGFDPADNPRMARLAPQPGIAGRMFPVINMTLNLTSDRRVAWSERKAASFTATPLYCGSPALGDAGLYVPTTCYAGNEYPMTPNSPAGSEGMTLATAMTISGAAVSPNWGYHSAPLTAFLMTLFNMRLGAWLPNPAVVTRAEDLELAMPRRALRSMLGDLLGMSTATNPGIYLSDGGHFENLGVYEMLRRRCRLIVVVDAGQDPTCAFADLGNVIRKAFVDLQVSVAISHPRIAARAAAGAPAGTGPQALGFAMGTIRYPEGASGLLLYVKPSWLADLPADVQAYGIANPEFPHESTVDQWFTESQFESYRRLGEYQMTRILENVAPGQLGSLFLWARRAIRRH